MVEPDGGAGLDGLDLQLEPADLRSGSGQRYGAGLAVEAEGEAAFFEGEAPKR